MPSTYICPYCLAVVNHGAKHRCPEREQASHSSTEQRILALLTEIRDLLRREFGP